jgi:TolB protein
MQLVGNANPAKVIIKLKVPGADSCVPLTWWNTSAVLSYCGVNGQPSAGQLWLVPTDGSQPTQLTQTSGSPSRTGDLVGAWQAAGTTYATVMNSQQCQGALNAPGGLAVVPVGSDGSLQQPINVQGATSNHTSVVSVSAGKLLVLAQTACPGTSSLLRFDPSTGTTTTVLAGQPGQVGVLAAVPFGGLQPAATNGQ